PNTYPEFSAENPGVLVLGVPSSLPEGRAKTRTPRTFARRRTGQSGGAWVWGFSGVSGRFHLEEFRVAGGSAGDGLMALGRLCSVAVLAGCWLLASVGTGFSAKDSATTPSGLPGPRDC